MLIGAGFVASLAFALAGCTGGNQTKTDKTPTQTAGTPTAGAPTNGAKTLEVTLQKANIDQALDHIKSHKGKVVVVDFWNYTCLPCKAEFPNLVKLQEKYGDKVAAVSVSVGLSADEFYDKSREFLKKKNASFTNYFVEGDEWSDKLDVSGVPVIFVYDQTGKRVAEFKDGFQFENGKKGKALEEGETYKEVNKIVEKLAGK